MSSENHWAKEIAGWHDHNAAWLPDHPRSVKESLNKIGFDVKERRMTLSKNAQRPRSERGRQFLDSVNATCLPKIGSVTVPILGIQNDRIVHDRSGILYQVGGHHFVLTASHYLRRIVQENIPLYLSVNQKGV